MQLIAGRVAQEFNERKDRHGAFWEDRYHATAVQTGDHLIRCLVYIDLNMVRAGVVSHPREWPHSGYSEIQSSPERRRIIDRATLLQLTGHQSWERFKKAHEQWIKAALDAPVQHRQAQWTDSLAVGDEQYLHELKAQLGAGASYRSMDDEPGDLVLKDSECAYRAHFRR